MAEQMKPSGIACIGDIPMSWKVEPIKYLVEFYNGDRGENYPSKGEIISTGIPFINAGHIQNGSLNMDDMDYISEQKYKTMGGVKLCSNDILYCLRGSIGKNAIIDISKGTVASSLVAIRSISINPLFLFFSLNTSIEEEQRSLWDNGTAQPNLSAEDLGKFKVCIPPTDEQSLIASHIKVRCGEIDSIIADIEKQIELLKQYKKSLITETVTKGLDKSVPMKDSGVDFIGKIPQHWGVKRLKYMLENSDNNLKVGPFGSSLAGSDYTDEGKWVYNQRLVLDNNFTVNDTFVSEEKYKELISFRVYADDILITTRGTIGKVAIVPKGAEIGILHPCLIRFRINMDTMISELLMLIFNESDYVKEQLVWMSNATTIEVIYSYSLKNIILPIIPIKEQKAIFEFLNSKCNLINKIITEKEEALGYLQQHKKSLIYEYVTGKKRVKEAM